MPLKRSFHSPLQIQVLAYQLAVLVESSRCAGPGVDSFVLIWRRAVLIPSDASVLRKVEQQNVLLHLGAGARLQLRHSRPRASRHFSHF